jgi:hypothetical protein
MIISILLGVRLGLSGSGSLALGSFSLVCDPIGWILRPYVQGFRLPVDDAWHMVLGPGRFQLAGFFGSLGFMTLFWVSVYSFKLPIS